MKWISPPPFLMIATCSRIALLLGTLLISGLNMACSVLAASPSIVVPFSRHLDVGETYQGVRLLGAVQLPAQRVDGFLLRGLSGLAWDESAKRLYAISDAARLFHLQPVFRDGFLVGIEPLAAYPLRNSKGQMLRPPWADAEGLAIRRGAKGTELLVSFEVRPRVVRYRTDGQMVGTIPLPPAWRDRHDYADPNQSLEAITVRGQEIWVAPEWPLRQQWAETPRVVPIVSLKTGQTWDYPLHASPHSALVAMEAWPDGSLLTLERAFVSIWQPLHIILRRASWNRPGQQPVVQDIAHFSSRAGFGVDNFEGLTRHQGQRFFIVSDDNRSSWQKTLLVYLEIR